jgi:hypothetical protein
MRLSFITMSVLIVIVALGVSTGLSQEQQTAQGQLKIEGSSIEKLVLVGGQSKTFNNPDEIITLPAGKYRLEAIYLKGGYQCNYINKSIIIPEDKQTVLKIGAPLKQTIIVKRQGRELRLNYQLAGIGGEVYSDPNRTIKPSFTVYKGDKIITSGSFQYG